MPEKTQPIPIPDRSPAEKRADEISSLLDRIWPSDEQVSQLAWQYLRDNKDQLALMVLQSYSMYEITCQLEEINSELSHLTDDNGNLSVMSYEQNG